MKKNKHKKGGNNGSLSKRDTEKQKSSQKLKENSENNSDKKDIKIVQNDSNQNLMEQAKMRSSANFEDEDDVMRGDEDSPRQIIPLATIQNIVLEQIQVLDEPDTHKNDLSNEYQTNDFQADESISDIPKQIQDSLFQEKINVENNQIEIQIQDEDTDKNQTADHYNFEEIKQNEQQPILNENLQFQNLINQKQNLNSERHAQNKRKNSMDMDPENSFVNVESPDTSTNQASNQAHKRKQSLPNLQTNNKRSAMKSKIINMTDKQEYKLMPKAIPLILFNQKNQQFEISEEAKEVASQIKGPIGVVSVVGMYRTGKSYLLNRVIINAQKGQGFGVGPTINPCTKGLWMWAQPLVGYTDSGEKINVIVIDTEGMGGLDEDNNHDMRIFSLALLLSSYFVYNSMGSIDENALAGLSFVTNITQHLTSKTSNLNKFDNIEKNDINEFMPKFMWIVRDFSLQLVDDQENEINSKQYLERALMDYNVVGGVSGSTNFNGDRQLRQNKEIDQKNEIKRTLRKYFVDRDCCTIVRPLVDENNLQNLENMNISDLRSEFVQQVKVLRKKILHGIRIKQIKNCKMDGSIWIQLAQQYLDSINGGSVPSIESSWSYLQKQRAQVIYEQIKQKFDQGILNDIQIPANEKEFEQCIEFHSESSLNELKNNFQGDLDIINEYTNDLQQFLSTRQIELRNQNLNECRIISQNSLAQLFQEMNQRLLIDTSPTGISQNIQTLEFTLQEILNIYEQSVPEFQEKFFIFLDMKNQFLCQLIYFVHQHLDSQLEQTNKILNDLKDRNQNSIQESRDLHRIEKQTLEVQLKESLINKAQSQATLELLKEQYTQLKVQKDQEDQENQQTIKKMKDLSQKKIDELKQCKEEFEEKMQEMNRKNIKIQSEYEKEKALFEQKVLFLEKSLEEKTNKEIEQMNNWTNHKSELSNEIRQVSLKYENELKNLNQIVEEEREKFLDIENQLCDLQSEYSLKTELWKDQELRYKQMLEQAQEHAKQIESASDVLKSENLHNTENKLKEKINEIEELQKRFNKFEEKSNSNEEEMKQKLHQSIKEIAIKEQKVEFLTIQLKETKDQLEDVNKQHQQMLEAMNSTQREEILNRDSSRDFDNIESPSKSERLQKKIDEYKLQLANLQEKLQDQELQLKLQENEFQKTQKDQVLKINELEKERNYLNEQVRVYQQQLGNNIELIEIKHKEEIMRLEQEIEEKQQSYESDMKSVQTKSEESLAQLKNFYEQEKEKLEIRLREEREKAQKKIDQYHEEFDIKMRNEFTEKDEEMDILRQDFAELQQRHNQQMTQVQHELKMKQQIIDTMEKQLEESKQRLGQIESTRNQAFEKQLEFFEQSRQEYSSRIDKLQSENLEKDRQLAQVQHKLERSQDENLRKIRDLSESQDNLQKQRDSLQEKLEVTKKKFTELQDEAQQNQLVFGRDQALSQQSIEFLQRKIEEMQNMFDEKSHFYEQKLMNIRQEIIEENQTNMERIQTEKDMWEQKFEQKRKALKEIEQQFNRENSELEKKLCLLQEKFTRLDQDKRKQESDFQERIHEYEAQIQNLDSSAGEAFYFGNAQAEQMMQLKTQQQELERQLSDLQSTYDKDKALWEGKCTFLENQKESYKKDLIESQRKFEITLEQLQKRGNHAHDKFEQNQNAMVKIIENKYKTQIKEMLESHLCLQNEIQNKSKRMEEENKRFKEQNAIIKRESEVERQQLEFRIQELQKLEVSLKNDLSELRNEKEKKLNQYQQQSQKDREIYKQRIAEAEKKAKEADAKRTQMIFEIEKEKARWQMEYDNLLNQKRDQDDIIQNLERRKDMIFKENERLKAEWKNNRNSVERSSIGSGTLMNPNKLGIGLAVNNPTGNIITSSKNLNLTKINLQHPSMMRQGSALGLNSNLNNMNSLNKKILSSTGQQQNLRGSQQNLPPQPKIQTNNNTAINQFPLQQMQQITQGNTRYNHLQATNSSDNNSADKTPQILIENQSQGFTSNINVQSLEDEQSEQIENQPLPEKLQNQMMQIPTQVLNQNYQINERGDSHGRSNHLKLGVHNFNQNGQVKSYQSSSQKHKFGVGNSQSSMNLGSIRIGANATNQQQHQFGNTMNLEPPQQQFGLSAKTLGSNSNSAYNQKTASRYSNKSGLD